MLVWLFVWSKVQTCIWSSGFHCYSLSLASVKSRLVLPFWYRLTHVVPDKGPLNWCVCMFRFSFEICTYIHDVVVSGLYRLQHMLHLTRYVMLVLLALTLLVVLFFNCPRFEGWPHHGRTFSIYPCPLSFWLTLPQRVLSTSWCCPSRPCMVFLACMHLALFLALSLSLGNFLFPHGVTIVF